MSIPQRIGMVKKQNLCRLCLCPGCQKPQSFTENTQQMCKRGQKFKKCNITNANN